MSVLRKFVNKTSVQKQTFGFAVIIGVLGLIWVGITWREIPAHNGYLVTTSRQGQVAQVVSSNSVVLPETREAGEIVSELKNESRHILDHSPLNNSFLISKRNHERESTTMDTDACGDLWFQDDKGVERLIAREVMNAKFSPDGRKIAYSNRKHELIIETLEGESLAQIPRAFDPSWCSDSGSISFLAIPSLDYPELQQRSVYDLHSGEIGQAGNETVIRNP